MNEDTALKKYVLAFAASPRKGGNSDTLCDRVLAGAAEAGAEVEKIHLRDLAILPCRACGACQATPDALCVLKDDMKELYPRLLRADVIVLAAPIYFYDMSAQLKLLLDRWYPVLNPPRMRLKARKAAVCLTYADADPLTSGAANAARVLGDIFNCAKIPVAFIHASAWHRGDINKNAAVLQQAFDAGRKLVA